MLSSNTVLSSVPGKAKVDDLLALMEETSVGDQSTNARASKPSGEKMRGTFAEASDLMQADLRGPGAERADDPVATHLLQSEQHLEEDIYHRQQLLEKQGRRGGDEPTVPNPATGRQPKDIQSDTDILTHLTQKDTQAVKPPTPIHPSDSKDHCSKLSSADAAAAQVGDDVRFILVALGVGYTIGVAMLIKMCTVDHQRVKIRSPKLLLALAVMGWLTMLTISFPIKITDFGALVRIMQWTEVFGVPFIIIVHGLRFLNLRAHHSLYRKRRMFAEAATQKPQPSRTERKSLPSLKEDKAASTVEEIATEIKRAKSHAAEYRYIGYLISASTLLLTIALCVQLLVSPCTALDSQITGLGIVVGIPGLATLCSLVMGISCSRVSDGFQLKAEHTVVLIMDIVIAVSQVVVAMTLSNSSHSLIGLLQTYRIGIAIWLCLSLATHIIFATRAHWGTRNNVSKVEFNTIFDQGSLQLRQQFTAHLHDEFAGGLMMLWDDIDEFHKKFSEPIEDPNAGVADTPQANLRRDTVRKAKLGLHARSIWNKYLVANSPMEVDLEPMLLSELTNRINCNTISPTMFDTVQELIAEDMQSRYGRFRVPSKASSGFLQLKEYGILE
jgi:hypothetical protein